LSHGRKGQQVGFNDGHVEWCISPYIDRIGEPADNIFTMRNPSVANEFKPYYHKNALSLPYAPRDDEPYDFMMTLPYSPNEIDLRW